MTDESLGAPSRSAHRAAAEPTSHDLEPEVEQTWVRPRAGRRRQPDVTPVEYAPVPRREPSPAATVAESDDASSVEHDDADSTDTAVWGEAMTAPRAASTAVSHAGDSGAPRLTGRRASPVVDPEAEAAERRAAERLAAERLAAERLAADRAAVAAQGEAIRRAAEHRRESEAVRPRAALSGPTQHVTPPAAPEGAPTDGLPSRRRLIAGGVYERPLTEAGPSGAEPGHPTDPPGQAPDELATRAIQVVREAGPGPTAAEIENPQAHPYRPERTLVMGILNVTLDSFSDGGRYSRFDDALAHARSMVADGADIIDIGGESTRPGAPRVEVHEEQRRVVPVIRELVSMGIRVSIDTMNAATAYAAVEAGADIINDVSGGLADENMKIVARDTDKTFIAMHWRGHSTVMERNANYADVVGEVRSELFQRVAELVVHGVNPDRLVIDPGLGFAKRAEHNWELLGHLDAFAELGLPILVAASRKRFLGALLPDDAGVLERDPATAVISALSAQAGAWGVRVHDVAGTRAALDVQQAWQKGSR
ncbi:dihydropteroate synthase [Frondihabitans cladoniiphilus]|uniref:dihydropteroate synthase n=1 Tax=Frondihabitans cladoniiphilus TaxID=715785 RepID=A0ABP8W024_9MICO